MSERIKAFWLGMFILCCLALLAWLLLFLRPSVGDNEKTLRVRFSNIEKIVIGTRVTFAGKPVGEVSEINEVFEARENPADTNGSPFFYELVLKIDSSVHLYSCDEILFSTSGLLGEKIIAIVPKVATPNCQPHEITDQILYARSTDKLQEAVDKLVVVANRFDKTLVLVNDVIEENRSEFHATLKSLNSASTNINSIAKEAIDRELITHMSAITTSLHQGEGTLGRLLHEDRAYHKLVSTLSHFDMLLTTINHYGIFFQFNSGWQKQRKRTQRATQCNATPCDYSNYINQELFSISLALDRISSAREQLECQNLSVEIPCLTEKFNELLNKVMELEDELHAH